MKEASLHSIPRAQANDKSPIIYDISYVYEFSFLMQQKNSPRGKSLLEYVVREIISQHL